MARPANPYGDPVSIRRKGSRYKIRFYPTGIITSPNDRKEVPGAYPTAEEATAAAAVLRAKLVEHRDRFRPECDRSSVLVSTAAAEFVSQSRAACEAMDLPAGTFRRIKSDIKIYIDAAVMKSDVPVKNLPGALADAICKSVSNAKKKDGTYKAENTVSASQTTLRRFGAWLVAEGYLDSDPFSSLSGQTAERTAERKQRTRRVAVEQAESPVFYSDDDVEVGLGLGDVPSLAVVSALSDAMFRRESGQAEVPNSHLKPVTEDVARQLAAMPLFRTATGLRHCETLAVHTSRIDLDNLTIGVDRQLARSAEWALRPPKHNRRRVAHVWPMFGERLRELAEWADENTDGWLFAAPRGDRWWTENCDDLWERAIDLMASEHTAAAAAGAEVVPPLWTWKPHYTRHAYGSYCLAPQTSGGLGWSLTMVSKSMGHGSETTTQRTYRHAISDEMETVKSAVIDWPGLPQTRQLAEARP